MIILVKRIERVKRSGKSKSGNDYTIDQTNIVCDVPLDAVDGFGFKEMSYQFGDHTKFTKLDNLRGKLPVELDITLGVELNQYDQPVTVVTDVKPVAGSK